ncbi:uncharacterized protein BXZ73DRAFT_39675 [Epithele typhae]|uniref:uncharacterized protein n=1 Tax=Epithele typhae TaxID=378194 RepID=UPI0020079436|nr:uncharacterized protein BXZ73DRAFT_39675 [Epithele typhae]KAH9944527.1 hypothetical protein BXZ73DRAFT_39675 [Epithele typhae]
MALTHVPPVLVDDLIPIILESDDHWWPRDFQRLALISPSWVHPVRKRLYARPSLRSFRACKLFARTLQENPDLLPYLSGVDLRPVADGRNVLDEQEMHSLRVILGLNGLREVTLGGDLAVSAQQFLHVMSNTRTITSLHIDGHSAADLDDDFCRSPINPQFHTLPSLDWDDVVAFRFPFLQNLTLSNVTLSVHPSMMDRPGALESLALNNVEIADGSLLPDLQGAWDRLRSLRVVGKASDEMDENVRAMLEVCEGLEELHYESVEMSSHPSLFDDDEPVPLPGLQRLCLAGFDANPHTLDAIASACPALTHLAVLGRMVRVSPELWRAFLKSGAVPHLQQLVSPAGTMAPPFTYWTLAQTQELRDACRARGVGLAVGSGIACSISD